MSTSINLRNCYLDDGIITKNISASVTGTADFYNQSALCKIISILPHCSPEKEKLQPSRIISYQTEAPFEYLNHICNPAFAVHPCPSPIFCHQEDKSELRGATPHFLPRLAPKPAQEWLPANFTVHSDFSTTNSAIRLLSPATSVIGGFLHRQSRVHYWLYLCHIGCHTDTP